MHLIHLRRTTLMLALLHCCQLHAPAHADQFDDLRLKWKAGLSGHGTPAKGAKRDDHDEQLRSKEKRNSKAGRSNDAAGTHWAAMERAPDRKALWPDLPLGKASANLTRSVMRLNTLAGAYHDPHSRLYQDAGVLQATLDGMDWLVAHAYRADGTGYDNWWDWHIGVPTRLNQLMITLYEQLTPAQIARNVAAIDRYTPDPAFQLDLDGKPFAIPRVSGAANRLDKALVSIVSGILIKDGAKIAAGRDAIPAALDYVTRGAGFYPDGGFIQHALPYAGSYGAVLLEAIVELYFILDGSPWPISNDPLYLRPYEWSMNAFRPFIYDGVMMDSQRGRAISREHETGNSIGSKIIVAMAELCRVLPPAQATELKSVVKGWLLRNPAVRASASARSARIRAILADPAIAGAPEPAETRFFPSGDRLVARRPGFAFSLAMSSPRLDAFESGNGENLRGWWTGSGVSILHNADLTQFDNNFWPTVDMWRLPGITTDHSGAATLPQWKSFRNTRAVVGAAELNRQFATAAMDFSMAKVTGSSLSGKKAWFLFGDRIVAAGSGISATEDADVETIVENRALNAAGSNVLTVNQVGKRLPATPGWRATFPAASWAHLAGNTAHGSDIGYVFPDRGAVTALRETRSGAWRDINNGAVANSNPAPVSNHFLSLALAHGRRPAGAAYTYILLPNRSARQTADFAAANPISVLERGTAATAVQDSSQGLTGIVFWNDAPHTVGSAGRPLMRSSSSAVVTMQQNGADLQLAVADPTQRNSGTIELELHQAADAVVSKDAAVTVTQLKPTIRMSLAVNGSAGKSFHVRYALSKAGAR